ncbi:MAG TPA: PilN domain-containing protein [Burkholderiaceae bacterium]|nr:PilN domain-containing protein [Burkholderiaceae bacterium]
MIRINLLPHREARRKQNKNAFFRMLILAAIFAAAVVFAVWAFINLKINDQDARNAYITAENKKLDKQIEEIATLKQDIEALKARQQAVEDLQGDRNQPVYLLDELVKQVPEGIFLRSFKQEGQKVSMNGVAQSNERVSELLRNLTSNSPWLEKPELIEIKASTVGQGKDTKKVFDFTMNVGIKRPKDKEKAAAGNPAALAADKAKAADQSAMPAVKPADTAATTSSPPTTGDKAAAKGASNAVANGAAATAPKKP